MPLLTFDKDLTKECKANNVKVVSESTFGTNPDLPSFEREEDDPDRY